MEDNRFYKQIMRVAISQKFTDKSITDLKDSDFSNLFWQTFEDCLEHPDLLGCLYQALEERWYSFKLRDGQNSFFNSKPARFFVNRSYYLFHYMRLVAEYAEANYMKDDYEKFLDGFGMECEDE